LICHQYLLLILALVLCLHLLHFGTASPPVFRSQDVPTKLDVVQMPGFHYNFARANIRDESAPDWDTMPLSRRYRNSVNQQIIATRAVSKFWAIASRIMSKQFRAIDTVLLLSFIDAICEQKMKTAKTKYDSIKKLERKMDINLGEKQRERCLREK
jgi:hypothetical protein